AYYYGQIRKKEKKFYVLCQDYSYGHSTASAFMEGLKKYFPDAVIVGEDYHPLFLKDFAPYLTKIQASGAEAIFTADWHPDLTNLIKQARELNIMIPIASKDMDNPQLTLQLGMDGSRNLFSISPNYAANPVFKTEEQKKFHTMWIDLWAKWSLPYNIDKYKYPEVSSGHTMMQFYWLLSVIERAKSTDPEKIIQVWEDDTFRVLNGSVWKMRPCDHRVIYDLAVTEIVPPEEQKAAYNIPPYHWFEDRCFTGPVSVIPAGNVLPYMDKELDRCKGKNGWGE
ncbi:MAG: ABC transporter substrate-binding protein, partial [Syntrophales bacterium]|nr:ABC transporter substrate-binding protein [Syntrophales bacterium]